MIWFPIVASARGWVSWDIPYSLYTLGSFGPMIASLFVTALTEGKAGIGRMLGKLLHWRIDWRYYAFLILTPFALFVIAVVLKRAITRSWPDLSLLGEADYLPHLGPFAILGLWLITFGMGEEIGWRGFALPHLQRKHSASTSTLILAILWAGWHLPAFFFRDTYQELGILGFPIFLTSLLFVTMVFTWLYNSTGGSLPIVILFHALFNWLSVSEAGGRFVAPVMSIPIFLWAMCIARIYGTENAAPVERQKSQFD